jgi:hypothetical protein
MLTHGSATVRTARQYKLFRFEKNPKTTHTNHPFLLSQPFSKKLSAF